MLMAGLAAIALLIAGYAMWNHETSKAEKQSEVNSFSNAILADRGIRGDYDETTAPNHHASIALLIAGGFAALTALLFAAMGNSTSSDETVAGQLARLNDLHSTGAITTDEFVAAKTALLRPDS